MRTANLTVFARSIAFVCVIGVCAGLYSDEVAAQVPKPVAPDVPAIAPAPATLPPRTEEGQEVRQSITFGCLRRKGLNDWVLENATEAAPLTAEQQKARRVAVPGQLGVPVQDLTQGGVIRPELAKPVPAQAEGTADAHVTTPAPVSATPGGADAELTPEQPTVSPILTDLPQGPFVYDLVAASIFQPKLKTDQTVQVTGVLLRMLPVSRINVSSLVTLADRCVQENSRK